MIKLYYVPMTRAMRPRWLLEEMAVPYELIRLPRAHRGRAESGYQAIHPTLRVPALVDGDVTMYESGAICMYLADRFVEKNMAPALASPGRGAYYQWMAFGISAAEPPVYRAFLHTRILPPEKRIESEVSAAREEFAVAAQVLSAALHDQEYLVENRFTAADVMIGSICAWAGLSGLLGDQPVLGAYVSRLSQRTAFQVAHGD